MRLDVQQNAQEDLSVADKKLYGPLCGGCGKRVRRRRIWLIGDAANCKCGWKTECVSVRPLLEFCSLPPYKETENNK